MYMCRTYTSHDINHYIINVIITYSVNGVYVLPSGFYPDTQRILFSYERRYRESSYATVSSMIVPRVRVWIRPPMMTPPRPPWRPPGPAPGPAKRPACTGARGPRRRAANESGGFLFSLMRVTLF